MIIIVHVFIHLGRERVDLLMLHRWSVTRCTDFRRTGVLRSPRRQRLCASTTPLRITCRNVGRRTWSNCRWLLLYADTLITVGGYVRGVGNSGARWWLTRTSSAFIYRCTQHLRWALYTTFRWVFIYIWYRRRRMWFIGFLQQVRQCWMLNNYGFL